MYQPLKFDMGRDRDRFSALNCFAHNFEDYSIVDLMIVVRFILSDVKFLGPLRLNLLELYITIFIQLIVYKLIVVPKT